MIAEKETSKLNGFGFKDVAAGVLTGGYSTMFSASFAASKATLNSPYASPIFTVGSIIPNPFQAVFAVLSKVKTAYDIGSTITNSKKEPSKALAMPGIKNVPEPEMKKFPINTWRIMTVLTVGGIIYLAVKKKKPNRAKS